MFILVHSDNELLKSDNDIMVFHTHKDAYAEMLDQLRDVATDEEIVLADKLEIGDLHDESDDSIDSVRWVGYLYAREAYIDDSEDKWCIFEVPGAFIHEHNAKGFKQSIHEMHEIYCDEDREDWFDADDMAKDIAYELEGFLG